MGTIDERIVKLSFDNKGFESGIQKTLQSLEKLNQALAKTDNRQAAKELTKSMNDINKILKNNNLGNLDKLLNKQSTWSKLGDGVSKIGSGLINAFKKIDFTGIGSKISSIFKGGNDGASALARGVENVTAKFSHLQVIAATALANITNRMVNAGIAMSKALTIDPVKDGFAEYETKMNAMQTIFANTSHKGTTYDDIKKALNELNEYSDKTIYNFGQMTDNIGKFTAAGVDLDTSVSAIKGLSNLAAMSGVDNARAQSVMYQASQALSKGYFQLMDWRSFSNNGMGNDRFKELLIETSDLLGTGASAAIKAAGSFDESLSKSKWLTNEVMNESLKMLAGYYTEADLIQMGFNKKQSKNILELAKNAEESATQIRTVTQLFDTMKEAVGSGWAQTWEWIVGDKEQATKTLTEISKAFEAMIKPGIEARNKMFEEWNKGGGRDSVISGFTNIFESVSKVAGSVKDAFRDIFPAMTSKNLIDISKGFQKLTENLKISDKAAAKIKDTFKGVFSIFDLAKTGITSIFKAFSGSGGLISGIGNIFLSATSSIGKFLSAINEGVKSSGIFDKIASGINNGLTKITSGFKQAGEIIKGMFKYLLDFDFGPIFDIFKPFATNLSKGFGDILSGVGKMLGGFNINGVLSTLGLLAGKGVFDKIKSVFDDTAESVKGLTKIFKDLAAIPKGISEVLKSTSEYLKAMTTDINAGALLKIAGAIAILALALSTLATIDHASLETALSGITVLFAELVIAFAALNKVTATKGKSGFLGNLLGGFFGKGELVTTAAALVGFSTAIVILAGAVKMLSSLKPEQLMGGLAGIAASMVVMVGAVKALDGIDGNIRKASRSMITLGIALNILALAVKQFGQLDIYDMAQGLSGIGIMLAEVIIFMELINTKATGGFKVGTILGLAVALTVLSNAVKLFGQMDIYDMSQGIAGIGAMLLSIAAFGTLSASVTNLTKTAVGVGVLAAALMVLQGAVAKFGSMKLEQLGTGILGLAAALGVIAVAMDLMNDLSLITSAVGLIGVAAALQLIVTAVQNIGSLPLENLGTGILGLAAALGVLAVAMDLMSTGIVGAAGMLVMAAALAVLTPQLLALSKLNGPAIGAAILTLALALGVLAVAGLAATAIAPGLAILAVALVALGVGCLAAGAGVALFATGLATLAAVGAGGMFGLTEALRNLINLLPQVGTKLGEALINMGTAMAQGIPQVLNSIGQAMVGILESIRTYAPQIITVAAELMVALCNAIIAAAPQLANAAVTLVLALANALANAATTLASAGADLIINLLDGISSRIGDVIQAAIDLGIALIDGLAEGLQNNAERVGTALGNLIEVAINSAGIMAKAALKELGTSGIIQLASGITGSAGKAVSAMAKAVQSVVQSAKSKASQFLSAGKEWVTSIGSGIKGAVGTAIGAIGSLVSSVVSKARSAASQFLSAAKQWVSQLASGIRSGASSAASAVKTCVSSAVAAAKGAASQFISAGKSMIQGLISGITSMASSVASKAKAVVQGAIDAAKSALQINSPSKVFIALGESTGEGMCIGLDRSAVVVSNSAEDMANSAISTFRNSIGKIASAVNTNIDINPTIRPVLDLSNIEAGARSLNGMLDNSQLNASLSGDMSRSIGAIQNGNNNGELLSAIKDLQGNVGNTGDTYQINGITYDDGSAISSAVQTLIRAAKIERRM